jgi:hypothetical protein
MHRLIGILFLLYSRGLFCQSYEYTSIDTTSLLIEEVVSLNSGSLIVAYRCSDSAIWTAPSDIWYNTKLIKLNKDGVLSASLQLDSVIIEKILKLNDNEYLAIGEKLYDTVSWKQIDICIFSFDTLLNAQLVFQNTAPFRTNKLFDAKFLKNDLLLSSYYFDTLTAATNLLLLDTSDFSTIKQSFLQPIFECCWLQPHLFYNHDTSAIFLASYRFDSAHYIMRIDTSCLMTIDQKPIDFSGVLDSFPYGFHGNGGFSNYQIFSISPNKFFISNQFGYDTTAAFSFNMDLAGFVITDSNFIAQEKIIFLSDTKYNTPALTSYQVNDFNGDYYFGFTKGIPSITSNVSLFGTEIVITKRDSNNNEKWSKTLGDSINSFKIVYLTPSTDGGVFASGYYLNKINSIALTPGFQYVPGLFVIKLDSNGNILSTNYIHPSSSSNFIIYPNPFVDVLNINSDDGNKIKSIKLFDLSGRVVLIMNFSVSSSVVEIDMKLVVHGNYVLEIITDSGSTRKKIIK